MQFKQVQRVIKAKKILGLGANFSQTDLFSHETHHSAIVLVNALHSPEITYAKKISFPLETFC